MSPESLLRQFEVMADAPNGVQKLRELILQLAVRGKLVPQDPGDEPASVLLERIAVEKQRLVQAGEIKKPKLLPPVSEDEVPFAVPEGWAWVRIGEAMNLVNGRAFKPTDWSTTGLPIVRIQNLNNPSAPFNYCDFDVAEKFYIDDEDLLLSWSGTPGTSFGAFVWRRGRAVLNQHIFRCELYGGAYLNDFVRLAINGRLDEMIAQAHGGVGLQHVTKGKLDNLAIVLPSLAEQRRIVAKVDKLMALCDRLEARQQQRAEARARLNRSALHHLTSATDDAELAAHWQRLRENFHLLYDTPETVAELRQAVLQLAVRGKLVPQDPSDEPAGVLLERIAVEKQRLVKEGKIGKPKPLPPVGENEVPFAAPEGWQWERLGSIGFTQTGCTPSTQREDFFGGYVPFVKPGSIRDASIDYSGDGLSEAGLTNGRLIEAGSVLMVCIGGSIGKAAFAERDVSCNQQINAVSPFARISGRYLLYSLLSPYFQTEVVGRAGQGTLPIISKGRWEVIPIPLPPLPEQQRIVAKVDELMALCDRLEAQLTAAREKSTHLAASVVHHLAAA